MAERDGGSGYRPGVSSVGAGESAAWASQIQRRRLRNELRRARARAGISQRDVAAAMDWSLSKVIRIESGSISWRDLNDLRHLARHYHHAPAVHFHVESLELSIGAADAALRSRNAFLLPQQYVAPVRPLASSITRNAPPLSSERS